MLEAFWKFFQDEISAKFATGIGTAFAFAILGYWKRQPIIQWIRRVFRGRKLRQNNWHTTFIKSGRARAERVKLQSIPFTNRYYGILEYDKYQGQKRHYLFSGRLSQDLFTATYFSKEEQTNDCGAWMLRLNHNGTALVGAYIWQEVNNEIGHDFYQWTAHEFDELLRTDQSLIDGAGLFPKQPLPKGALIGEFKGVAVKDPTRESIKIAGQHIHPLQDCILRSLNHSCDPNARLSGQLLFLAEAVDEESEITIDYRVTESTFKAPFRCKCPTCQKDGRPTMIG